jgi:hypothetical protein
VFQYRYVIIILIHGEASYDNFTEDWLHNNEIGQLAQKVSMVSWALGDPTNAVSEQGILDKYMKLATRQMDFHAAKTLKYLVLTMEQPKH